MSTQEIDYISRRINRLHDNLERHRVHDIDPGIGYYNVGVFGAKGDGVTDDTDAIAAAFAAASGGGIIYFPPGAYLDTSTHYLASGMRIMGAGTWVTSVTYTGADYWLDTSSGTIAIFHVTVEDLKIVATNPALGAIRCGRTSQAYNAGYYREFWDFNRLWIIGSTAAGAIALSFTQLAVSRLNAVWVQGGERAILCDRTTANHYYGVRAWADDVVWEFTIGISGSSALVEEGYCCEIFITSDNGIGLKVDAQEIRITDFFIEAGSAITATAYLWLTDEAADFYSRGTMYVFITEPTNLILIDAGFGRCTFDGDMLPIAAANGFSIGTPASGIRAQFVNCTSAVNTAAIAQGLAKVIVEGVDGSGILQAFASVHVGSYIGIGNGGVKTALDSKGHISLADDGTALLLPTVASQGLVLVMDFTSGNCGLFFILQAANLTTLISSSGGEFVANPTPPDGFVSVYWSGTQYEIKNRMGAARTFYVMLMGVR